MITKLDKVKRSLRDIARGDHDQKNMLKKIDEACSEIEHIEKEIGGTNRHLLFVEEFLFHLSAQKRAGEDIDTLITQTDRALSAIDEVIKTIGK